MNYFSIYWDVATSTYPAKKFAGQRVNYCGHINPIELGNAFVVGVDKWTFQAPKADAIVNINNSNIANLQTLVNSAISNTKFLFRASAPNTPTIYEGVGVGNIEFVLNRPVQFEGELSTTGEKLITLNGSQVISSFTLISGKYRATVPDIVGSLPDGAGGSGIAGYYPQLEGQVWVNDLPYNAVDSTANMTTAFDFYHDKTNNYIYLNFNPSGFTIRFGVYNNFCSAGNTGANARVTKGTDNVVVRNLNFTQYCGNRNGSVIGKRGGVYQNDMPMKFWLVENCRVYNCRGDAVYIPQQSVCRGVVSEYNGRGSIRGGERNDPSFVAGYTTTIYTIFEGNKCSYNNWAGNGEGDSTKMYQSYFVKVLDSEYSYNGYTSRGLEVECNGLWFDVCAELYVKGNRIFNNYAYGLFIEISFDGVIEYNEIFDNVQADPNGANWADIYNSTAKNMEYRYNTITAFSNPDSSNISRPYHLLDGDRGTDDQYGARNSNGFSFHHNTVKYRGANGRCQISYQKSDAPSPSYRGFSDKNIVINNNTYLYPVGTTASRWWTGSAMSLATVQALVDDDSDPFNWEQGSTINAY